MILLSFSSFRPEKFYFSVGLIVLFTYLQLHHSECASDYDKRLKDLPDESTFNWENYKAKYNKHYSSPEEEAFREELFEKNVAEIKAHNVLYLLGKSSFVEGVNQFTDLTSEEMKKHKGLLPRNITTT